MKLGVGFTITGDDRAVDPPLPVQVMLYVVLTVGETEEILRRPMARSRHRCRKSRWSTTM